MADTRKADKSAELVEAIERMARTILRRTRQASVPQAVEVPSLMMAAAMAAQDLPVEMGATHFQDLAKGVYGGAQAMGKQDFDIVKTPITARKT